MSGHVVVPGPVLVLSPVSVGGHTLPMQAPEAKGMPHVLDVVRVGDFTVAQAGHAVRKPTPDRGGSPGRRHAQGRVVLPREIATERCQVRRCRHGMGGRLPRLLCREPDCCGLLAWANGPEPLGVLFANSAAVVFKQRAELLVPHLESSLARVLECGQVV